MTYVLDLTIALLVGVAIGLHLERRRVRHHLVQQYRTAVLPTVSAPPGVLPPSAALMPPTRCTSTHDIGPVTYRCELRRYHVGQHRVVVRVGDVDREPVDMRWPRPGARP